MNSLVYRVFVEKKNGFNIESRELLKNIEENLNISDLKDIRILNRYDVSNISKSDFENSIFKVFAEKNQDNIFIENFITDGYIFGVEYLPGQFDQRADSASQCIQIITGKEKPIVKYAKIIVIKGNISKKEIEKIKDYYINPVDSREASLLKPLSIEEVYPEPPDVSICDGFILKTRNELETFIEEEGLAMSIEDILFCQDYFKNTEGRNPTLTEIKVIDTYWSDHCRHTTFLTKINDVVFQEGKINRRINKTYKQYLNSRNYVYSDENRDINLMDIATISMKELRKRGKLDDLEVSDEINACSIEVKVDVDGKEEDWLVMFKNETHNHPTEIEPFGGAATCLGGAIRDPLSGRSYVYQAMRVTGAGDPRTPVEKTLTGKLPQKKIVQEAADGYSSYGNQIGLATGMVNEIYNERYLAKHMEIGAVIAAAPKENVVRGEALPGDIVILLGGKTGRDGCGGATGSSKVHTEDSIEESSAEVQKGNPPTERKIQRLFRNPKVSKKIKVCNDFGAGGVSVAIGELADALEINLNAVPKKYEGLDGTELAISESQERMAVVIEAADVDKFIELAAAENLEATVVAEVKDHNRLIMDWNGNDIVNLSRTFLDTNGATQKTDVRVLKPIESNNYFKNAANNRLFEAGSLKEKWMQNLADINVASQKGLVEKFDSSIGAG